MASTITFVHNMIASESRRCSAINILHKQTNIAWNTILSVCLHKPLSQLCFCLHLNCQVSQRTPDSKTRPRQLYRLKKNKAKPCLVLQQHGPHGRKTRKVNRGVNWPHRRCIRKEKKKTKKVFSLGTYCKLSACKFHTVSWLVSL